MVHLLREITNIEMDLRFEAAAANELYENTKNDEGFNVPKIYWNYTSKRVLTLDKVNGTPIREYKNLKELGIDLKSCKKSHSTFFETSCKGWFFSWRYASRKFICR